MQTRAVLQQADIERAITRIAHEILEAPTDGLDVTRDRPDRPGVVLLGIPTRGALIAARLAAVLERIAPDSAETGTLDVTMYRDDLGSRPTRTPAPTVLPASGIDGRIVVLVDDVLYSGRTVRAALDAIGDLGRPAAVRLAVLIDRGHRELPIRADFVGRNLPSSVAERINVLLTETDGEDAVVIA